MRGNAPSWTRERPQQPGYYWLRTVGYERGIVVWVFHGMQGDLVVDRPLLRPVAGTDGCWAGPLVPPDERGREE